MTTDPMQAPDQPEYVELTFARGVPYAINGNQKSYLGIIYELNEIAGKARLRSYRHDREPFVGSKAASAMKPLRDWR